MTDDGRQGELFEEFKEVRESKFKQFAKRIMPPNKHFTLVLPLENVVIISIVIIMGLILSYAFGVEKGRQRTTVKETLTAAEPVKTPLETEKPLVEAPGETRPETPETAAKEPVKKADPAKKEEPFTIQLIAFKSRDLADRQAALLKKRGYEAFVIPRGLWYEVCTGKYADKQDALGDIEALNREFKDCFLRRR